MVSVIVPTYNRADLIRDTLDSIWHQTYRPIELVIADDGSTDDSKSVVEGWLSQHQSAPGFRGKYIVQGHSGAQIARNTGIDIATGEYLQFLDSDDVIFSTKISSQVERLLSDDAVGIVYGDWIYGLERESAIFGFLDDQDDMLVALLSKGWVPPFSYLFRREAVGSTRWDPRVAVAQDLDFALRIAGSEARFARCPVVTGWYREHIGSRVSSRPMCFRAKEVIAFVSRLEEGLRVANRLTGERAWAIAHQYLVMGREAYRECPEVLGDALMRISRVCPDFRPRNLGYRLAVGLLGYEATQRLWNLARDIGVTR